MSRKLPALRRAGFTVERIKGSHHHLLNAESPSLRVVVPVHRGDLPAGTVNAILRQAGLSQHDLLDLLRG